MWRRIFQTLLSRKVAISIGVTCLLTAIGTLALYVSDRAVSDSIYFEGRSGEDWLLHNSISLGTRSTDDFTGLTYSTLPTLYLCPRGDGRWEGRIEWLGSVALPRDLENASDLTNVPGRKLTEGQLVVALPKGTTQFKAEAYSSKVLIQAPDQILREPIEIPPPKSLRVTQSYDHEIVSFNPFDSGGYVLNGRLIGGSDVAFILPSMKIRTNGYGDEDFEFAFTSQTYGEFTLGVGSATPDTKLNASQFFSGELDAEQAKTPRLSFGFCQQHGTKRAGDFSPAPSQTFHGQTKWIVPLDHSSRLDGRLTGGFLYQSAHASLTVSLTIFGALLGAVYGVAMTVTQPAQGATLPTSPPAGNRSEPQARGASTFTRSKQRRKRRK
jgi:hypothetical protein